MKPVEITPDAEGEVREASDYYDTRRERLGAEFEEAIAGVLDEIQRDPERWAIIRGTIARKRSLKRWPYAIIYLDLPDRIVVVAVANFKRRPMYWLDRI